MSKGFASNNSELKIEAAVKRLIPSAKRGDVHAFCSGIRKVKLRRGADIADEAMRRVIEQVPDICNQLTDVMPSDMKNEFYAKAIEVIADVLESSGLRLEDHLRVCDEGMAITSQAVQVLSIHGVPERELFGRGNDSLSGMGIERTDGFIHPLSEVFDAKSSELPEDTINLWGFASTVISGAQGWIQANKEACLATLKDVVFIASPTTDLSALLYRSRYDDRALLKLCSLIVNGFEAKADQSMREFGG
ncbi:MAG: hypothetical protein AAGA75_23855 [Cyanobacteria bacterium P01_E01_bin.6]